jgi:hypothetical protein
MGAPTNEAFRRGIKAHVKRWINNIEQYENVPMDLTVNNLVVGADSNLRNMYKKFTKLTSGVVRDIKQAGVTQTQFEPEVDFQIKMEENVGEALMVVKGKMEEFKNFLAAEERTRQEKTFMLMFNTQQRRHNGAGTNHPTTRNSRSAELVSTIDCCYSAGPLIRPPAHTANPGIGPPFCLHHFLARDSPRSNFSVDKHASTWIISIHFEVFCFSIVIDLHY